MNERIKELAEQAYKEVIETNDYNGSAYTVREFDKEKFAELIVRECIGLADKYAAGEWISEFDVGYMSCAESLKEEFKEHFGVE